MLLVLAASLGGIRIGVERLRLTDAAAQVARAEARDESAGGAAAARIGARLVGVHHDGELVCASVRSTVALLGLPVPIVAESCALVSDIS